MTAKELTKKPHLTKDDNFHFDFNIAPSAHVQADILFMPTVKFGYKYLLNVVDVGTRKGDSAMLKNKDSKTVTDALNLLLKTSEIFDIDKVERIDTDPGSEFNNAIFKQFVEKHKIFHHIGLPNNHRQQAIVERYNQILAEKLFLNLTDKELKTKKQTKDWAPYLRKVINEINASREKMPKKHPKRKKKFEQLLPIGTKVRAMLFQPINAHDGKPMKGDKRFRATDIRWSMDIHKIEDYAILENKPVLYKLTDIDRYMFTRNQLTVVK